jgi:hypothetical protein
MCVFCIQHIADLFADGFVYFVTILCRILCIYKAIVYLCLVDVTVTEALLPIPCLKVNYIMLADFYSYSRGRTHVKYLVHTTETHLPELFF